MARLLIEAHPGLTTEIITVSTRGDRDQRPLGQIGGKGLFMTEVEAAVLDGRADVAVHSAKDLTSELAPGCAIAAVPQRAPVEDVVVGGRGDTGEERLATLPSGARVGTSSMRRRALLGETFGHVTVTDLRGNLDTRLRKVAEGEVDAAVLAHAGIHRLGSDVDLGVLDADRWVPAPGQGALAIEAQVERSDLVALLEAITDPAAMAELLCERAFSATLEGGCSVPLGCRARATGNDLIVTGYLGDAHGGTGLRDRISGPVSDAATLGVQLAQAILASGGDELLEDARAS